MFTLEPEFKKICSFASSLTQEVFHLRLVAPETLIKYLMVPKVCFLYPKAFEA